MGSAVDMLAGLLDRPIAFHRSFVDLTGSVNAALFLSQAVFWGLRNRDGDGWWSKTASEWEGETGLTRREQDTAKAVLEHMGILRIERRGMPATSWFRVEWKQLFTGLRSSLAESAKLQIGGKRQTGAPFSPPSPTPPGDVSPTPPSTPLKGGRFPPLPAEGSIWHGTDASRSRFKASEPPVGCPDTTRAVKTPGTGHSEQPPTGLGDRDNRDSDPGGEGEVIYNPSTRSVRMVYPPDFERFWACYPRKVGKGGAANAWRRLGRRGLLPPVEKMIEVVEACAKSDQWQRGYIPHPQTWLNQHRWEDDVAGYKAPESKSTVTVSVQNQSMGLTPDALAKIGQQTKEILARREAAEKAKRDAMAQAGPETEDPQ